MEASNSLDLFTHRSKAKTVQKNPSYGIDM